MNVVLSTAELEALKTLSSPTVANAIETFNVKPRNQGFMDSSIRCLFPDLGVMVGYAVTAKIEANRPAVEGHRVPMARWWEVIEEIHAPRVLVMQDLDTHPTGAFWGEVMANVHKALGCVGVVTNGGARDLEEVKALGFHVFAAHILVSHAYIHLVEVGGDVKVGGLVVKPGDLLHADRHGVITIPLEIARDLVKAAEKLEKEEREIIEYCQSPEFTFEGFKELWRRLRPYS